MDEKERDALLRRILTEVLDVKVRIAELEMHLKRQDKEAMEVLAASRRLTYALERLDDGEEGDIFDIPQN